MKFIPHFQDPKKGLKILVVYLNRDLEGGGEQETPINKILSQPLQFNLADLQTLEKAITAADGKLTGAEQNLFQQLVNLHLVRLSNEKLNSQPSRLLLALFRNPKLSQFLSVHQRQAIELKLSQENQTLEKLVSKKVEDWSEQEAIALARSYRFVRSRLNTMNLSIDESRRNAGDKIKIYAHKLSQKLGKLSNKEKLFLIEIARIFPNASDWSGFETSLFDFIKSKAKSEKQIFLQTLLQTDGTGNRRISADAQKYWDTFIPDDEADNNEVLTQFLQRSAQVESLEAIAQKTETLKEGATSKKPLVLSQAEWKFLQDLTHQTLPVYEIDQGSSTTALTQAKTLVTTKQNAQQNLEQQQQAQKTALEAKLPAQLKTETNVPTEIKSQFDDRWLQADQIDQTPVPEGQTATPQQQAWAGFKTWKDTAIKAILAEKSASIETAKKETANVQAEVARLQENITQAEADLKVYKNPTETAANLLSQHKNQFKERLVNGRLVGGDFNFLRYLPPEKQREYLGPGGEQIKALIEDTRQAVSHTISQTLSIDLSSEVSENDLAALDKFLSYEAIIQQISATKLEGNSSELLTAYENIKGQKILDPAQIIGAVAKQIREDILSNIKQPTVRQSGVFNQFLNNYTRQHHDLEKTDRVERLLSFNQQIEQEKKEKINHVYEHAYEKVSALFATTEEAQVLADLNAILKTEISVESVLNNIRADLPSNGFIHQQSAASLSGLQCKIVNQLKGKVTPENDNEIYLALVAQSLLTKLDQLQAGENAKVALKYGAAQMEAVDKDSLSVTDRLELAGRTKLVVLEVENLNENFQHDLENIKTALNKEENATPLVGNFLNQFDQTYKPKLIVLLQALVAECDLHFGQKTKFTLNLETELTARISILSSGVDGLRKLFKENNLKAGDQGYTALQQAMLTGVLPLFDLHSGKMARVEENKLESTLSNVATTHKYVRDKLEFLQGEGAEKGRKNFYDQLEKYEALTSRYKTNWEDAKKRLEKDLKRFDETEFVQKYSLGKSQACEIIKNNNQRVIDADYVMDYFSGRKGSLYSGAKNEVFARWAEDYENPETQPKALHFMNHFQDFENILGSDQEDFAGQAEGFEKFIRDHKNNKGTLWFKKRYQLEIKWYTLSSIWQTAKQTYEFWGKKNERERDRMAADLGARIWGDTMIGREFSSEANTKEEERVNHFKKSFEDKDVAYLFNRMNNVTRIQNKDEAKAAIILLIDKGALRWDSHDLLELLSRLQSDVVFNLPQDIDSYLEQPANLKAKIGRAIATIWDRPTWDEWQASLPSKYESRMKTFETEYTEQIQKGGVKSYLENMLDKWSNGTKDPTIEVTKYEKFIQMAFDRGEMNGYPGGDTRWFFLVKGLTVKNSKGETILGPDAITRFTSLVGKVPYLDALDDKNSWKKDGKIVPVGTPGGHEGSWTTRDIQHWGAYFSALSPSEAGTDKMKIAVRKWLNDCLVPAADSQDRMGKVTLTGIDRDDAGMLPLLVSSERLMDGVLRYASGDKRPVDDKYYVNLLGSFENNFNDSVRTLKRMVAENQTAEGYDNYLETQLRRFGEIMRTYFMISQVLAGNWDSGGSVGAVVLSDSEWSNNKGNEIYEKITTNVAAFLGGEEQEQVENLQGKRYKTQKSEAAKKSYEDKKAKGNALSSEEQDKIDTWNHVQAIFKGDKFSDINLVRDFLNRVEG